MSVITPENNVVFEYLDGIAKEFKVNWTSPLSASPGEMDMFPTPPSMPAPMQPQVNEFFSAHAFFSQHFTCQPYQPPPQQQQYQPPPSYQSYGQPVLPGAQYSTHDANLASSFPSVPAA